MINDYEKHPLILYGISDATGETVRQLCLSLIASMNAKCDFKLFIINCKSNISETIDTIKQNPGPVFISISSETLENEISLELYKSYLPFESILSKGRMIIENYYKDHGIKFKPVPRNVTYTREYKKKISAIEYSISVDDGINIKKAKDADIVIIGPSRTSKTPVSIYTATQGYKTANIPIYKDIDIKELEHILSSCKCVIGFTIHEKELMTIRLERAIRIAKGNPSAQMSDQEMNQYTAMKTIQNEINITHKLSKKLNFPIVNITRKTIEEISYKIIDIYKNKSKIKINI